MAYPRGVASSFSFRVNGVERAVDVEPDTPLLWVLREQLGLTGTKFGCGMALCGACTVHLDDQPVRACMVPVREVNGKQVLTIEGLAGSRPAPEGKAPEGTPPPLHPLQQAWMEANVPQCGYCQSGQIMSALALLRAKPTPTDEDIDAVMSANICRCGTYPRIRKAIHAAAVKMRTP